MEFLHLVFNVFGKLIHAISLLIFGLVLFGLRAKNVALFFFEANTASDVPLERDGLQLVHVRQLAELDAKFLPILVFCVRVWDNGNEQIDQNNEDHDGRENEHEVLHGVKLFNGVAKVAVQKDPIIRVHLL